MMEGRMGVDSKRGVGIASVDPAEATSDESGVGGNTVISLSVDFSLRSDCLLFWNHICMAFSLMLTLRAISMRRAFSGVEPFKNSWFKMASSLGDVLLLFLRANDALSMDGSCEGYVAGEWLMKAKSLEGDAVAFLLLAGRIIESLTMDRSASESMETLAAPIALLTTILTALLALVLFEMGVLLPRIVLHSDKRFGLWSLRMAPRGAWFGASAYASTASPGVIGAVL